MINPGFLRTAALSRQQGTAMSLAHPDNPSQPLEFPAIWASEWGQDEIGLWMGFTYKGVNYRFRWILPGTFKMGSNDIAEEEKPVHDVTITQGFWLGETTVTQALWQAVMGDNPSDFKGEDLPVEKVSWDDAKKFIETFHQEEKELRLCLPTEAQWEYACRAGTETEYFFGDEVTHDQAQYSDTFGDANTTVAVKVKPANAWGLYQMHGNVWEWCEDRYDKDYYQKSEKTDPSGPSDPSFSSRVLRGGSWRSLAIHARSAYRFHNAPGSRYSYFGFRLARG